ncbi:MAG: DNA gyrase subunit A [Planctomycetes bacterium]|nr:DNA gyrase subunit A [Planctomycetota bacterium]
MTTEPSRVFDQFIEDEMKDSYLNYAMSVIVSRALPDVRDGLKPSQRRILVAMNDLNLGPRSKSRKCAKICGDTSGNYHPHGEQVVYPTLVRMAQDFSMRYRLVDGQGNFGSIDADPPAAMRYTEARMTEFATLLLEDLDKNTVDFKPNYDETREEPTVFPSKFPNLLCNGSSGIAVGMATSIPPHNFAEIADAIIRVIENPDVTIEELLTVVKGPDFPTGAKICGTEGLREAYTTGRGRVVVRSKVHTEEVKGGRVNLIVTEIPYYVQKNVIIDRIAELVKDDRVQGIRDVRDESDKEGMRIVIEIKQGEDDRVILNQLFQHTPLQETFSIIMIALVDGRPETLTLKDLLVAYRKHRVEVIRRRTQFLLEKAEAEAHILEGLMIALANIDEVIAIIKASKTVEAAHAALVERFRLSPVQADAILRMSLSKLTGLEQEKIAAELARLREEIAGYRKILSDENLILDIIREDLLEMKEKYGDKRRTEIVGAVEDFSREDLIQEEDMAVVISHEGYIKRMALDSYRKQGRGGKGVIGADTKEGDFIEHLFIGSTHDYILFFTDRGRVYWQKVYDLPLLGRQSKGRSLVNLLQLDEGERISSAIPVRTFDERFLFLATKRGLVKKTALSAYGNPKKGGIIAINLEEGDRLIGVRITSGKDEVMLGTRDGMAIRFPEEEARPMGRATYGVTGMKLREGDEVCDFIVVNESSHVLSVCENGYGKRTEFTEYRSQSRGGIGLINIKTSERNGRVVAVKEVTDEDDLMIITQQGMVVRFAIKGISLIGRATQGVRLITLDEGDKVVSVARVGREEERNGNGGGEAPPAPTPPSAEPEPHDETPPLKNGE